MIPKLDTTKLQGENTEEDLLIEEILGYNGDFDKYHRQKTYKQFLAQPDTEAIYEFTPSFYGYDDYRYFLRVKTNGHIAIHRSKK